MAHAKDAGIGQAFQQKSRAHEDKLRRFEGDQLSCDMDSLFTEELHSDMTVKLRYKTLHMHSCILKARSLDLYNILFSLTGSCKETKTISMKTYACSRTIEDLFRTLYTENDVTRCLNNFAQIFATGSDTSISTNSSGEVLDSSDNASRRNKVEQDQSRTLIRDSFTNSSESMPRDNKDRLCASLSPTNSVLDFDTIQDENKLDAIAGEIVAEALRNAFLVYGGSSTLLTNGDVDSNTNVLHNNHSNSVDINYNADIENNAGKTGLISNEAQNIRTSESTSSEVVAGALGNSISTENESELNEIKSTKQASDCSVAALLEKTYSVKTVLTPSGGLGEDLLRLWLTKTDCDAQILINGHVFHVHKCILSCRSMYFGAMLGGSWRESDQDQIVLEGIDNTTMRQTLLYLYGGVVEVDPSCSLGGLVKMSDMYTMEGLMEVVAFNLNKEYCHYFHKPCPKCIVGTPEALTLTMIYNMDTMREKCVKWINKNFGKVWPTKQFALLPQEVLEFCVTSAVKDLAINNVIDIMVECQRLNEKIPRLKWSESILSMTASLMDAAIEFASQNFVNIVSSKTFRNIDNQGMAFNIQPLEDIFGMVIMALSPENSCQSYMALQKWVSLFKARKEEEIIPIYSEEFADFVKFLFKKCKEHLCLYIHQAAHTVEWTYLPKDSQKEIMEEANYVCIDSPNKSRMVRPQLTSMQKKVPAASRLSLKEYIDIHFGFKGVEKKSKIPSPVKHPSARSGKTMGIPTRLKVSKTDAHDKGQNKKESSAGIRKDKAQKLPISGAAGQEQVEKHSSLGAKSKEKVEKLSKERTLKSTITGVRSKQTIEKRASPTVKPKDEVEGSHVAGDKVSKTVPFVKSKVQGKASPKLNVKLNEEFETSPMASTKLKEREETPFLGAKPKDKVEVPPMTSVRSQSIKTNTFKKSPSKPTGIVSDPSLNKSKLVTLFKTKPRGLMSPINNSTFNRSSSDTLDETESLDLKHDIIEPSSDKPYISVEKSSASDKTDPIDVNGDIPESISNIGGITNDFAESDTFDNTDTTDIKHVLTDPISDDIAYVDNSTALKKTDALDLSNDAPEPGPVECAITINVEKSDTFDNTDTVDIENGKTKPSLDEPEICTNVEKSNGLDKTNTVDITETITNDIDALRNVEKYTDLSKTDIRCDIPEPIFNDCGTIVNVGKSNSLAKMDTIDAIDDMTESIFIEHQVIVDDEKTDDKGMEPNETAVISDELGVFPDVEKAHNFDNVDNIDIKHGSSRLKLDEIDIVVAAEQTNDCCMTDGKDTQHETTVIDLNKVSRMAGAEQMSLDKTEALDIVHDLSQHDSDKHSTAVDDKKHITVDKTDDIDMNFYKNDRILDEQTVGGCVEMANVLDQTDNLDRQKYINDRISDEQTVVGCVEMANVLDQTDNLDRQKYINDRISDEHSIVESVKKAIVLDKKDDIDEKYDTIGPDTDKPAIGVGDHLDWNKTCESVLQEVPLVHDIELTLPSQRCLSSDQALDNSFDYRHELRVVEEKLTPILEVQFVLPE